MKKLLILIFIYCCNSTAFTQQFRDNIDIQNYRFNIEVNDTNDIIQGEAIITLETKKQLNNFNIDLQSLQSNGKGMIVQSVKGDFIKKYNHQQDLLQFELTKSVNPKNILRIYIKYAGVPTDGLIISKTKYGRRAFFADHWPQRAHCWLPCVDHPSDKASLDFTITAPNHYKIVANGTQTKRTEHTTSANATTYYHESKKIPTKVMTIGIADFTVEQSGVSHKIPVYSWIYPEDRIKGFYDFKVAPQILDYFSTTIGTYGYQKLANVQSKTRFGGLENANAIFYAEDAVKGDRSNEQLLAHEIAHQWFGNMATETDWPHLWLSEGFATYFSMLYMEHQYGKDTLKSLLQKNKIRIIGNPVCESRPVIDHSQKDPMNLLNRNSYEKGGWILHMLRSQLGDSIFFKAIQKYYTTYSGRNAQTEDLQRIFETVSNKPLDHFFKQWLYTAGVPTIKLFFQEQLNKGQWEIVLQQRDDKVFEFPITVDILLSNGTTLRKHWNVKSSEEKFFLPTKYAITKIILDPELTLLYK